MKQLKFLQNEEEIRREIKRQGEKIEKIAITFEQIRYNFVDKIEERERDLWDARMREIIRHLNEAVNEIEKIKLRI